MNDAEKLQVLLTHWIEHNTSHGEEFLKWAKRADEAGMKAVSEEISAATDRLLEASNRLRKALNLLNPKS